MRKGLRICLASLVLALIVLSCSKDITITIVEPEKEEEEEVKTEPEGEDETPQEDPPEEGETEEPKDENPQPIEGMVFFEDPAFKAAVLEQYDSDGDGELSQQEEALRVVNLNVSGRGITSLVGLEDMHNIQTLDFSNNDVREVDFSAYPNFIHLREVNGSGNHNLTKVDVGPYGDKKWSHCATLTFICDHGVTYEATFPEYYSTEFSYNDFRCLEENTRGRGAYIIFELDGYVDKDWENGIPERLTRELTDEFFSLPPLSEFRDCFSVYLSEKVSPSLQMRSEQEASNPRLGEFISEAEKANQYCLTINVTNNWGISEADPFSIYREGWSDDVTFFPRQMWLSGFTDGMRAIVHECGHAIGGLTDQYDQYGQLRVSENFTYDSDPKAAPWSMFFSLENYKDRVGFHERNGGYYPSPTSIMDKHNSCKWFDSPSRYALWYNCHLIAGLPMATVWEDFLEYDRVNDGIQY